MALLDDAQDGNLNIDIKHFAQVLRQKVLTILFITSVASLIGVAIASAWPDQYESKTLVLLKDQKLIDDSDFARSTQEIPVFIKARVLEKELRSRKWIQFVLDKLGWVEYFETGSEPARRVKFTQKVQSPDHLKVEIAPDAKGDDLVSISFSWDDPEKARDFVMTMRDYWIEKVVEDHKRQIKKQHFKMRLQLNSKLKELAAAQEELDQFLTQHVLPIGDSEDYAVSQEREILQSIDRLQAEISAGEQARLIYQKQLEETPEIIERKNQVQNPEYLLAQKRIQGIQARIRAMEAQAYTEAHPRMVQARREHETALQEFEGLEQFVVNEFVEETNPQFTSFKVKLVEINEKYESDIQRLAVEKDNLEKVRKRIRQLPLLQRQESDLRNKVDVTQEIVNEKRVQLEPIKDRVESFSKADPLAGPEEVGGGAFEILEEPIADPEPTKPMAVIFVAAAMFFGLSASCVWFIARDIFNDTFTSGDQVRRNLGLPILGAIAPILTEIEVRRAKVQKAFTIAASVLFLVAFAAAIYVCTTHPEVIPPEVQGLFGEISQDLG